MILVEGLGKRYLIGQAARETAHYQTLRDALSEGVRRIGGRFSAARRADELAKQEFWALRDVGFEVKPGERLGIIGRNGAGKSTLLKIISRITHPTTGRITMNGRVASLLEVGTGFHGELTGRENITLNGAILGMTRSEIRRKFDAIVEFSEIGKFLDTPVKRYSSGMYVRLAFAVAAHLEPEILVVDEVLAVGDAAFQKKCLGKMGEVSQNGRTVLFVSHNMVAVQSLCDRALWLEEGRVQAMGGSAEVVTEYLSTSASTLSEQAWDDLSRAPGNEKVRIRRACVRPAGGRPSDRITIRTPFVLEFDYLNLDPGAILGLSLHIYNEQGVIVLNPAPIREPEWHGRPFPAGLFRSICQIPGDLMNDGMHRVELLVVRDATTAIYRHPDILAFDIQDDIEMRSYWHGKHAAALRPNLQWTTELLEQAESSIDARIVERKLSPV